MTKKDYQAIATAVYNSIYATDCLIRPDGLIGRLSSYFKADNPNFNGVLFREACITGTTKGMRK